MLRERDWVVLRHIEQFKGITVKQAKRLFYNNYEVARRRLKMLEDTNMLRSYNNKVTNEKVYYGTEKISAHGLFTLEFYSLLIEAGCEILEFNIEEHYYKKQIRPDAFIKFKYEGLIYLVFLEVDLTHFTSISKYQTYEMFYKTNEMQLEHGAFPLIVVLGDNTIKYESDNIEVIYLGFKDIDINKVLYE